MRLSPKNRLQLAKAQDWYRNNEDTIDALLYIGFITMLVIGGAAIQQQTHFLP